MNSLENGDFYFGISDNKIYICFFEKEMLNIKRKLILKYLIA